MQGFEAKCHGYFKYVLWECLGNLRGAALKYIMLHSKDCYIQKTLFYLRKTLFYIRKASLH